MLFPTIKRNPGILFFDTFWRINFRSYASASNFRGNTTEFRIARSDAMDNGRRKYYTSAGRRSPTSIFPYPRFRRFIEKAGREYGVKVRNPLGAQHLSDKSEAESHLRKACVLQKVFSGSSAIFNIKQNARNVVIACDSVQHHLRKVSYIPSFSF